MTLALRKHDVIEGFGGKVKIAYVIMNSASYNVIRAIDDVNMTSSTTRLPKFRPAIIAGNTSASAVTVKATSLVPALERCVATTNSPVSLLNTIPATVWAKINGVRPDNVSVNASSPVKLLTLTTKVVQAFCVAPGILGTPTAGSGNG